MIDLMEALDDAKKRLAEAEKQAASVPRIRDEVRGLELAVAQHNGLRLPDPLPLESAEWSSLSRSAAVLRVIEEAGKAVSPSDIVTKLEEVGRVNDAPHYVSSTLNNLKKRGKVSKQGYGRWIVRRQRSGPSEGDGLQG